MMLLILDAVDQEFLSIIHMNIENILDIEPETLDDILHSLKLTHGVEAVEVYELSKPVTFEKQVSYTINQGD